MIKSILPNGFVLNSDQPYNPHGSRVIIRTAGGNGNLETFRFCTKSSDHKNHHMIGLLASYDLKYILQVSSNVDGELWRYLNYIIAPGPIVSGEPWPNWVTPDMVFNVDWLPLRVVVDWPPPAFYVISSAVSQHKDLAFDVFQNKDEEGNFVVVYPIFQTLDEIGHTAIVINIGDECIFQLEVNLSD